jgi:hypothetical protein
MAAECFRRLPANDTVAEAFANPVVYRIRRSVMAGVNVATGAARRQKPPSYRHHKPTGQGVVTLNGKDIYLGKYGTPESQQAYDRVVAEWLVSGRQLTRTAKTDVGLTVSEVAAAFLRHAESHYVGPDGQHTSELGN